MRYGRVPTGTVSGGQRDREGVGNAELLKQRLGLEVSNPDRGDLSVSDGPTVDDLDHRIGASHTLVDDRVDTAVRGDNTDSS